MPLSRIIPVPRLLEIGGRDWLVSELTLRDVATLEAFVEARLPRPVDCLPDRGSVPSWAWHTLFEQAWDRAEEWPPDFDSPLSSDVMQTLHGTAFFLWLTLRRFNSVEFEEAAQLSLMATPRAWREVNRVAYGVEQIDELDRMLEDLGLHPGGAYPWEENVYRVCESLKLTPDEVADMTISQFFWALRQGKPKERGLAVDDGMSPQEIARKMAQMRKRFYGEDGEDGNGNGEANSHGG